MARVGPQRHRGGGGASTTTRFLSPIYITFCSNWNIELVNGNVVSINSLPFLSLTPGNLSNFAFAPS